MLRTIPLSLVRGLAASAASNRAHWLGLLTGSFILGLASSLVVPFLSLWGTRNVGMSSFAFGLFMSATALSSVTMSTLLARWSDTRAPRRAVLLLGAAGGALGYAGYAVVTEPLGLMAIGVLILGFSAACFPQLFAHAREELASPEYVGLDPNVMMSLLRAVFTLAWTVGPALGALLFQHYGQRGTFLAASGLYCLLIGVVAACVPSRAPLSTRAVAPAVSLGRMLARPLVFGHFAAFSLVFAAFALNLMNLPLLLTTALGGSPREVGVAFAIGPLVEMPLMLWLGRLAARGHQPAIIRFGFVFAIGYFLSLMLARSPEHIYPLQVLSAVAVAVTMSVAIPYFQDLLPGQTGVATSLYSSSYSCGCLLGYFGFGLLEQTLGQRGMTLGCATLGVLGYGALRLAQRHAVPTL